LLSLLTSDLWQYNSTPLLIVAQTSVLWRHNSTPLLILDQASAWCQSHFISLLFVHHHPIIGNISTLSLVIYRHAISGRVHSSPTFWVSSSRNEELKSCQINRHSPLPTIHHCILPTLATCSTCNVNLQPTSHSLHLLFDHSFPYFSHDLTLCLPPFCWLFIFIATGWLFIFTRSWTELLILQTHYKTPELLILQTHYKTPK